MGTAVTDAAQPDRSGADLRGEKILAQVHDAVVTTDLDGLIESWNAAATRIYGWSAQEVAGRHVGCLYFEEDLLRLQANVFEPLHDAGTHEATVRGRHKSGHEIFVALRLSLLRDESGRPTGIIACSNDVTDRLTLENEARREREFATGLFETARCIMLVLDTQGRILRFNPFTEELTGYSLDEVRGHDWFETFLVQEEQPRIRGVFQQAVSGIRTAGNVNGIRIRSGSVRQIAWWDTALHDAEGTALGILAVGHDITELLASQERALLDERLAAVGETMQIIVHESRNHLDAIGLHLRLLEKALHGSDRGAGRHIGAIKEAHAQVRHLFDDLRDFAAPFRIDRVDANLSDLWRKAWASLDTEARHARLTEGAGATEIVCPVDPIRLQRVFRNLFENALTAGTDPVEISIGGAEVERDGAPWVRLTIRDNGPGIRSRDAEIIFDPFYTTGNQGTGLGLAVVRRILEAHGGTVALTRTDSPGAEFEITLPKRW